MIDDTFHYFFHDALVHDCFLIPLLNRIIKIKINKIV